VRISGFTRTGLSAIVIAGMLGCLAPAMAQDTNPDLPVGYEVFSTNTPGGGGELQSQGLTGERTAFAMSDAAPAAPGVVNVVVTYYASKEALDKAKAEKKKRDEEKKKKKEIKEPARGPDVPTYDPRFWDYKDGKLVPHKDADGKDHSDCPKPPRFECGQHYLWWLKHHKHVEKDKKQGCAAPTEQIMVTGTVVAGEEATATVLDPRGTVVCGAVVQLSDGRKLMTDENGQVRYNVPIDTEMIALSLVGTSAIAESWIWKNPPAGGIQFHPQTVGQLGQTAAITGHGLPRNGEILVGGQRVPVYASSPTGYVVGLPNSLGAGTDLWC